MVSAEYAKDEAFKISMDKECKAIVHMYASSDEHRQSRPPEPIVLTGETSPGVTRIEALTRHFTFKDRILLFITIFLLAYCYTLDGTLRHVYQPEGTASYGTHSLLATITVVRGVIASAAQPTAAKIADVFGRIELLLVSVLFYVVGTIIEAVSNDVHTFATGAVMYQIGWTCVLLLVEVIIADVTSLRSRLFFSFVPAAPYLINTWVSGNISEAVLSKSSWRWGVGMWAIIYPVMVMPVVLVLFLGHRRAKKLEDMSSYKTPFQMYGPVKLMGALFWQLDVIGIVLIVACLGCILVPLTLASDGAQSWEQAHIIAPMVVGFLLAPLFVLWQAKSPHPMVPFKLLKDRAVWGPLGMVCMLNFIWFLQGDYLYTVAIVAFDQSILSATRITGLFNFFSVLAGIFTGIAVFYTRRLKPFIVAGTVLYLVSFGLLVHFRGGTSSGDTAGLIGAQILLGIACGLFPYPGQASIQAATKHEHVAIVTGLYLALYSVGSALGNAVSGAIWRQVLPGELERNLAAVSNNATLAAAVFGDPFTAVMEFPVGTPERDAIITSYRETQRLLTITGLCLCVPLIGFALCLRDPRLTNSQSLPDAEEDDRTIAELTGSVVEPAEQRKLGRKIRALLFE